MMNYADMALGTWYPKGGMHEIIKAFINICKGFGVELILLQQLQKSTVLVILLRV